MTRLQRIRAFVTGGITLYLAALMMLAPDEGYPVVLIFISLGLMFYGIRSLIYYFTMARFMVGGRMILYRAIVMLDFGYLTATLSDIPRIYVLIYLIVIHAFSALVEILRAGEDKRYGARSWKLKLSHGIVNLIIALVCIVFIGKHNTAVYMYSLGLMYSAIVRIVSAFRKTTFIYIQ
ncbi:MAG: hypothetical protein K5900_05315 [Butyrivibrio sp.]|nr:hypothetical protein [Butyrivibrio sp.]